jgi:hypothetical protein
MRKYTSWAIFGLIGSLPAVLVAACSVGTNGTGPERGDGSSEGSLADASSTDDTAEGDAVVADHAATTDARVMDTSADVALENEAAADATDAVADAHPDGPLCTSSNCGGACCGDECVNACTDCTVGTLFCPFSTTVVNPNGQCVASCSTCTPDGIPLDAGQANGTCGP